MTRHYIRPLLSIAIILLSMSCVYTPTRRSNNQRVASHYLSEWQEGYILPAFETFAQKCEHLEARAREFKEENSLEKKQHLLDALVSAYLSFQEVLLFDQELFADGRFTLGRLSNSYPTLESQIVANIDANYTLSALNQDIVQGTASPNGIGLPALDFLLREERGNNYSPQELHLIHHLALKLKSDASEAYEHFKKRKEQFVANDDFSVYGSLSITLNHLIRNYEHNLRTAKVGIPIGIYGVVSHSPAPSTTESYYYGKKLSNQLLKASLQSLSRFYYGAEGNKTSTNSSFRTFLKEYLSTQPGIARPQIIERLDAAIGKSLQGVDELENDISDMVRTPEGLERLKVLYRSIQEIVGILKTDAITALGLSVTFHDGEEGD